MANENQNQDPPPMWRELSEVKQALAGISATLDGIKTEQGANRECHHQTNNTLQTISSQLSPIVHVMPEMQKKVNEFNDLKNKGLGIIIAASAAGAVLVEVFRVLVDLVHSSK
jgi:alpha-ketoglutarate-dependent taurine dioxygenase